MAMIPTPKSFRKLAKEMREQADGPIPTDRAIGIEGCAESVERLADEWEQHLGPPRSWMRESLVWLMLGPKEKP